LIFYQPYGATPQGCDFFTSRYAGHSPGLRLMIPRCLVYRCCGCAPPDNRARKGVYLHNINMAWRTTKASLTEKAGWIYPACAPRPIIAPARAFTRDSNTAWRSMKASLAGKAGRIYPACAPCNYAGSLQTRRSFPAVEADTELVFHCSLLIRLRPPQVSTQSCRGWICLKNPRR
jgi:hypothetical protein